MRHSLKKELGVWVGSLLLAWPWAALAQSGLPQAAGMISSHDPLPEPALAKPAKGARYRDPVFGTTILRLTDATAQGSDGFICYYPKLNPFNADESRILIYRRGGEWHVYSIAGAYLQRAPVKNTQTDPQPRWHPTDPNRLYWFDANKIMVHDFASGQTSLVHTFPEYQFVTDFDEGNFSRDGRYVGLAGKNWPWSTGLQEFFLFDLASRQRVGATIAATGHTVDWVSASPSGKYLVVLVGAPHGDGQWQGLDVYRAPDLELMPFAYYPFSDHADLGYDEEGREVYVTDNAEATYPDRLRHLEKYRLDNGEKTDLLGCAWGLSRLVSCRNFDVPGWAIISTYSSPEHLADENVHPFDDEIFAVKLDGSRHVRRIAHHRSQRFSVGDYSYNIYWDQPNAVISRSGKFLLFSSNWRKLGGPQDVYLIDLREQEGWIAGVSPDDKSPLPPQNVSVH
ncbi:MAG: hypothetical protein DKINENOH_04203 [bacterium]|nr:hypothetical protein [bacterium]